MVATAVLRVAARRILPHFMGRSGLGPGGAIVVDREGECQGVVGRLAALRSLAAGPLLTLRASMRGTCYSLRSLTLPARLYSVSWLLASDFFLTAAPRRSPA